MYKHRLIYLLAGIFIFSSLHAQDVSKWYTGISAGATFGVSSFSSFGSEKTRVGWNAGVLGGYHLSDMFAVELSAGYSQVGLGTCECSKYFWLGENGKRYYAPVIGSNGASYTDIYSKVSMTKIGAHFYVDLLRVFKRDNSSSWSVYVAPAIYAVFHSYDIKHADTKQVMIKGKASTSVGLGGDIAVGYKVNNNISLRLKTGIMWINGKEMDGIPEIYIDRNYVWNTGIDIIWNFTSKKSPICTSDTLEQRNTTTAVVPTVMTENVSEEKTIDVIDSIPEKDVTEVIEEEKTPMAQISQDSASDAVYPVIYFSFNSVWIEWSERDKMKEILRMMKENPESAIVVKGWTDPVGTQKANQRVSIARAKAVKDFLVLRGIKPERITCIGMGVSLLNNAEQARHTETQNNKE
ncbi:MAG: OmpA family protein [Flavobacteriales bacterium]|nr:OmpA family protein [Flavobacteriales bacterium]